MRAEIVSFPAFPAFPAFSFFCLITPGLIYILFIMCVYWYCGMQFVC